MKIRWIIQKLHGLIVRIFGQYIDTRPNGMYSHLSNKREVTITDFEKKFHPPHLLISYIFSTLLSLFIAVMYQFFFQRNSHPPRLFQPPRLLILQLLHPLHVQFNLQGYQRDESTALRKNKTAIFCQISGRWSRHDGTTTALFSGFGVLIRFCM